MKAQNLTFSEKITSLNLERIAQKLMHRNHGQGLTQPQADQAIARYKMFLHLLYLYPNGTIVPTQEIDQVWHQHILDTRKYAEDCQWLFGYFVHHYPYFGMESEADRQALETAFAGTRRLFAEHFGIDLTEDIYNPENACAILPTNQVNQASAGIDLKEQLSRPSACIELCVR